MAGPSVPNSSRNWLMIATSRVCTRRVPPDPIRDCPMRCEISVRRLIAEIIVLSSWFISFLSSWIRSFDNGSLVPLVTSLDVDRESRGSVMGLIVSYLGCRLECERVRLTVPYFTGSHLAVSFKPELSDNSP